MGTPKKDEQKAAFLVALRERGVAGYACKSLGISRRTVYNWKRDDADFAKEWEEAVDDAVDAMEAEAYRRAKIGTRKPVFQQGRQVGYIREYSDTLLIFMLKAKRPNEYRETGMANMPQSPSGPVGGGLTVTWTPARNGDPTTTAPKPDEGA